MLKNIALAFIVALFAVASPAAQATAQVELGKPFTVAWDWAKAADSGDADGFKLEVNGVVLSQTIPVTERTFVMTAPSSCAGGVLRVGAYNQFGTTWSNSLAYTVIGCPPNAPTNLRIIVTVTQGADGSWILKLENVEIKQ